MVLELSRAILTTSINCLAFCRPNDRHTSLALYILLRGVTLLIRCGNKPDAPPAVRKVLTPTRWQHGDTTLMCLATSQILYSWIMMPHTLPPSYIKFLNRHGGRQQWHYNAARVCSMPCLHMSCAVPPIQSAKCASKGCSAQALPCCGTTLIAERLYICSCIHQDLAQVPLSHT